MSSQDKDKLNFESANRAVVSASDQDSRYTAALQVARELNTTSIPDRALKPFNALSETIRQLTPLAAAGIAISVAGIVAAGIAAALNSSKRPQNAERRTAEEANAARQIVLISQVVVYRRWSIRSEVFDRRDDLAGKRF